MTLVSPRRFIVTVTGVGQGTYPTSAIMRASSIIAFIFSDSVSLMKSGTMPFERSSFSMRNIKLTRKNGEISRIDLYKYFATRDERFNPFLREGDVLTLQKYDWEGKFLAVQGAVQFPGVFEYIEGDDLETAIELVRGVTTVANMDSIIISRMDLTATKMEKFCGGGGGGGGFNWDMCVPEWVGTPTNGTPYTNAAGLKCKYTGTGPGAPGTNYYYLCCPGA